MKPINPQDVFAPPPNSFAHAVLVQPDSEYLFVSGQVAIGVDGTIPEGAKEQAELTWTNLLNILKAADMTVQNLVRMTTYIVDQKAWDEFAKLRTEYFKKVNPPASTGIYVPQLILPKLKIEVEAIAAKPKG
ncbi:MAG: RidA family protein [Pseudomonadota bacterium]